MIGMVTFIINSSQNQYTLYDWNGCIYYKSEESIYIVSESSGLNICYCVHDSNTCIYYIGSPYQEPVYVIVYIIGIFVSIIRNQYMLLCI